MLILYDDSVGAPTAIRQIVGVEKFGDVLRRKKRLSEVIEQLVLESEGHKFVRATSAAQCLSQIDAVEQGDSRALILRIPSCLVPLDLKRFLIILQKLPYALDMAMIGRRFDDEAITLLSPHEARNLLRNSIESNERRSYLTGLADRVLQMDGAVQLADLRDPGGFLHYMTGATETRHFNAAKVDGGVFRKYSSDKAKMRAEYAYFGVIPEQLKRFLLPTFGFVEEVDRASYAMENMAIPDAALQLVHHSFDSTSFGRLLDRFFDFIGSRQHRALGVDAVRRVARQDILEKCERRLDLFLESEAGKNIDSLLAASGQHGNLHALRRIANAQIERAIQSDTTDYLATGHGDPCLSNILFNRELGIFRLIDPKGATTLEETYMHPLYDLAKFSHSILGGYDFINNGLFDCRLDAKLKLELVLDGGGTPVWMQQMFKERLAQAGFDIAVVRAYELSLFLSMLPLHMDVPRKLPAFCLVASKIISELDEVI